MTDAKEDKDEMPDIIWAAQGVNYYHKKETSHTRRSGSKPRVKYIRAALNNQSVDVEALNTWQPIETAPKDGTVILTCCMSPSEHTPIKAGYMAVNAWTGVDWPRHNASHCPATHWMPLPEPPEVNND